MAIDNNRLGELDARVLIGDFARRRCHGDGVTGVPDDAANVACADGFASVRRGLFSSHGIAKSGRRFLLVTVGAIDTCSFLIERAAVDFDPVVVAGFGGPEILENEAPPGKVSLTSGFRD